MKFLLIVIIILLSIQVYLLNEYKVNSKKTEVIYLKDENAYDNVLTKLDNILRDRIESSLKLIKNSSIQTNHLDQEIYNHKKNASTQDNTLGDETLPDEEVTRLSDEELEILEANIIKELD